MTPPLTDTELLAYIERTPELRAALIAARLYANELFEEPYIPPDTRRLARAFHAAEQRAREEEREACAKVCERRAEERFTQHGIREPDTGAEYYKGRTAEEYETRDEEANDCAAEIRALNGSTATQLSTANAEVAPSPEGAGQGEAAEAVGLLRAVKKDLEDRAEDGVVELSSNVWQRLCDYLTKQEGKS